MTGIIVRCPKCKNVVDKNVSMNRGDRREYQCGACLELFQFTISPLVPIGEEREEASTGAKRDSWYPPGVKFPARYDLMFRNAEGMRRLAETWGEGFVKYGPDNWMKGFPSSVLISHALEHIRLYLKGDRSEDHLAHGAWNLLALCWVEENKPELLDLTMPDSGLDKGPEPSHK